MPKVIRYSLTDAQLSWMSNSAPFPVLVDGRIWPTVEHYVQAQRLHGSPAEEVIRRASSPLMAVKLGCDAGPSRSGWDDERDAVMKKALMAKYGQHPALRRKLLETGDAVLKDTSSHDPYWGEGADGSGSNRSGQLLMEVREQFRTAQETAKAALSGRMAPPSPRRC